MKKVMIILSIAGLMMAFQNCGGNLGPTVAGSSNGESSGSFNSAKSVALLKTSAGDVVTGCEALELYADEIAEFLNNPPENVHLLQDLPEDPQAFCDRYVGRNGKAPQDGAAVTYNPETGEVELIEQGQLTEEQIAEILAALADGELSAEEEQELRDALAATGVQVQAN